MPFRFLTVVGSLMLVGAANVAAAGLPVKEGAVARPTLLQISFGSHGLESLAYEGVELMASPSASIRWSVPALEAGGKPAIVQDNKDDSRQIDGTTITRSYEGLTVATAFSQVANTLRMVVSFRNTSQRPVAGIDFRPFTVKFPRRPQGTRWAWGYSVVSDNTGAPGIAKAAWDNAKMLACVDEIDRPVTFGFEGNYGNAATNSILIQTSIDEPLAPGTEISYRFSLRFGRPDDSSVMLAHDLYGAFAKAYPYRLDWPDRRPIGALFLCNSATGWKTNPRGWFNDPKVDVTIEDGRKAFRDRLMNYADASISMIKQTGGQGMILWDVEGQEMKHAISYLGDPRILPQAAPEMDACADEFFRKFRDAGLKTGICIRPSRIVSNGSGGWKHIQVADHVGEMADKIAYARKRWGCAIIYMDTNVKWDIGMWQGDSHVLPAKDLCELTKRCPGVLIFPEFGTLGYFSCCMPYGELRGGTVRTGDIVKKVYPLAGSTLAVGDGDYLGHWDDLLAGAAGGDIQLFRGWFGDPVNTWVRRLYQEAGYFRKTESVFPRGQPMAKLLADPDPAKRYAALAKAELARFSQQTTPPGPVHDSDAAAILARLESEDDWPVQRKMVEFLGKSGDPASVPALVALVKDRTKGLDTFAAQALGRVGKAAVPALLDLLQDKDARLVQTALDALANIEDPRALPGILPLADSSNNGVQVAALMALGAQHAPESKARLIAALADSRPDVLIAACGSLARLNDRSVVPALVELILRSVQVLHNNDVRFAAGEALESLTGLEYGPFEQNWKRALTK